MKLFKGVRRKFRYWLVDDVHPIYEPARFVMRLAAHAVLVVAAIVAVVVCAGMLMGCGEQVTDGVPIEGIIFLGACFGWAASIWFSAYGSDKASKLAFQMALGFALLAFSLLNGCGPECTPAFPIVGNYEGEAGHYTFRATHRLPNGARVELHRPELLDELESVVTLTLEYAERIGPTLTELEMHYDRGSCVIHLARVPRCDERECLKIRILEVEDVYVSRIDWTTLLLRDTVEITDDSGCWVKKPFVDPRKLGHWPAGCQQDGTCVAPIPSGEIFVDDYNQPAEGIYGRWGGLIRALLDWKLGCYNSVLIPRIQKFIAANAGW